MAHISSVSASDVQPCAKMNYTGWHEDATYMKQYWPLTPKYNGPTYNGELNWQICAKLCSNRPDICDFWTLQLTYNPRDDQTKRCQLRKLNRNKQLDDYPFLNDSIHYEGMYQSNCDIDECEYPDVCQGKGTCTNTVGSYTCSDTGELNAGSATEQYLVDSEKESGSGVTAIEVVTVVVPLTVAALVGAGAWYYCRQKSLAKAQRKRMEESVGMEMQMPSKQQMPEGGAAVASQV